MKASPGRSVIFILISLLILANASCNKTSEAGRRGQEDADRVRHK